MHVDREELLHVLIPPAAAVALTLIFFATFDRWNEIHDPINSIVVTILGLAGFVLGVLLDRLRLSRARGPASAPDGGTPPE